MNEGSRLSWATRPLGALFRLHRESISPSSRPTEIFEHFSIPAFDETGGPAVEPGCAIASNKTLLSRPAILVSKLNPRIHRVVLVRGDPDRRRCASTEWMPYVPSDEDTDLGFFTRLLASDTFQRPLQQVATGSTNSHVRVSPNETLGWAVPLPPLPEQRRIARILDTLDEAIRGTERVIAKLQQMKQGLLHDLLTRGIDENGELRDPERHPEQFMDSPLGRVPSTWDGSSVAREFEVASGITLGPHRAPRRHPRPYLRVANVHHGRLVLDHIAVLEATAAEMREKAIAAGDLLVVEGHADPDEIGRCAMATDEVSGYTFQNHLFRLRPRRLRSCFAAMWLNSSGVRSYWHRVCSTSSGLNTINRTTLFAVAVAVPDLDEQDRICGAVDACDGRLKGEGDELAKLRTLKAGLMDDLLTGRVRVPIPEEASS